MTYVVVRTAFHDQLSKLVSLFSKPLMNLNGNCLLMGRTVVHPAIRETSACIFALFHLCWRANQKIADRRFKLTMHDFLLHSEADTRRLGRLIEHERRPEYVRFIGRPPAGPARWWSNDNKTPHESSSGIIKLDRKTSVWEHLELARADKRSFKQQVSVASLDERYIRYAMCYEVIFNGRLYYRIRPNRTPEAREKLLHHLANSYIITTLVLSMLILTGTTYVTMLVLTDRRYLGTYPGCTKWLEDYAAKHGLPFFSITVTVHRSIAFIIEGIENLVVWLDCGYSMIYGPTYCYLLNCDLLLYWSSLHAKLELFVDKIRRRNFSHGVLHQSQLPWADNCSSQSESCQDEHLSPASLRINISQPPVRCNNDELDQMGSTWLPNRAQMHKFDEQLEAEIVELMFELYDFFHEVGRVDLLVSDVLTALMLCWLSFCAMVGYEFITTESQSVPPIVILVLFVGVTVVTTATYFLITLRRRCFRTYQVLCSLIALNQSGSKKRLLKLMDFFTQINRTTYTLAHSHPYKPTTFITIAGYTASCLLIAITLFDHSHPVSKTTTVVPAPSEPKNIIERIMKPLAIY